MIRLRGLNTFLAIRDKSLSFNKKKVGYILKYGVEHMYSYVLGAAVVSKMLGELLLTIVNTCLTKGSPSRKIISTQTQVKKQERWLVGEVLIVALRLARARSEIRVNLLRIPGTEKSSWACARWPWLVNKALDSNPRVLVPSRKKVSYVLTCFVSSGQALYEVRNIRSLEPYRHPTPALYRQHSPSIYHTSI